MIWTTTKFPNLMDDFFMNDTWNQNMYSPSSRIETLDNAYIIKLAVPGIKKEEMSIEFDRAEDLLEIKFEGKGNEFVSRFKKSYKVPSTVDYDKIEAEVADGILTVTMVKKEDQSRIKVL